MKVLSLSSCLSLLALGVSATACNFNFEPQSTTATASAVAAPVAHEPRNFLVPGHSALGASNSSIAPLPALTGAPTAAPSEAGALLWKKPDAWKEAENKNSMRIATYVVPHAKDEKDDGEVSVSRAGGGLEANIDRWVNQFEEAPKPERKELSTEGLKVTIVKMTGTYKGGMAGGGAEPKPGSALVGIIAETESGDPWFFKITGSKETIISAAQDIDALIGSFRVTTE